MTVRCRMWVALAVVRGSAARGGEMSVTVGLPYVVTLVNIQDDGLRRALTGHLEAGARRGRPTTRTRSAEDNDQ